MTRRPTRPWAPAHRGARLRRWVLALGAAVAVAGLASCGVPADGAPREISAEAIPPEVLPGETTTTTTTVPPYSGVSEVVLVTQEREQGNHLYAIDVRVEEDPDVARMAADLLTKLVAERGDQLASHGAQGLKNRIPSGTEVLGAELLPDGVLVIDFSEELQGVEAEGQVQAMAQIVFTATELPGVNAVRIKVEGQARPMAIENGVNREAEVPVFRTDYPQLNDIVRSASSAAGSG